MNSLGDGGELTVLPDNRDYEWYHPREWPGIGSCVLKSRAFRREFLASTYEMPQLPGRGKAGMEVVPELRTTTAAGIEMPFVR